MDSPAPEPNYGSTQPVSEPEATSPRQTSSSAKEPALNEPEGNGSSQEGAAVESQAAPFDNPTISYNTDEGALGIGFRGLKLSAVNSESGMSTEIASNHAAELKAVFFPPVSVEDC